MKILGKVGYVLAALLFASTGWGQAVFSKYGPVNGVQFNDGTTYQDRAAAIADLQPILSTTPGLVLNGATGGAKGAGTVNATGLYVNGSAVGVGGGAVSSVGLTAPTCFGVTGSPITSAGSLGLTLTGTTANFVRADGTCSNQLNGVANAETIQINGSSTTGQSYGLFVSAGTNGSDLTYQIWNQPQTHRYSYIAGDGSWGLGFNGTANDITANAAGNVVVAVPSSGAGLTVNGLTASYTVQLNSTGAASALGFGWNQGLSANQWNIFSQSTDPLTVGTAGNAGLAFDTNSTQRLTINGSGNVTVNAPTSGSTVTENVLAGTTYGHVLSGTTANNIYYQSTNGTQVFAAGLGSGNTAFSGTISSTEYDLGTGGNTRISINSSGNVTVNGPSGTNPTVTIAAVQNTNTGLSIQGTGGSAITPSNGVLFGTSGSGGTSWRLNQPGVVSWDFLNAATSGILCITSASCGNGITITANGNVGVQAPPSGVAFTANGTAGASTAQFLGGGTVNGNIISGDNGANLWSFGRDNVSSGEFKWALNGSLFMSLSASGALYMAGATGGAISSGSINATGLYVNGVAVGGGATQTSGSFTSTLSTGCTTTPTATLFWVKTGNVVTLSSRGTGLPYANCTANSPDRQTDASLPTAIRPAVSLVGGTVTLNDNSASVVGCMNVLSTGNLRWGRVPAAGTQCGPPNMGTSGNTGIDGFTITYLIN